MNERIQELIKLATFVSDEDELFPREVFDKEKFAELLTEDHTRLLKMSLTALQYVREDYLNKDGLGFDLIASSKMFSAVKRLEEHFGVEK